MEFVGAEHLRVADDLVRLFQRVAERRSPALVCLSAPAGSGKTRVGQELYARLAAGQAYWPASLTTTEEPWLAHDVVQPGAFTLRPGARLEWMWWGVQCGRRRSGAAAQVIADDLSQLLAHERALLAAAERTRALRSVLAEIASAAAGFIPFFSIGTLLNAAQGAIGGGRELLAAGRAHRAAQVRGEGTVLAGDTTDPEVVGRTLRLLAALTEAEVPLVWFLDDAGHADAGVVELLDAVFAKGSHMPILCVATARPDELSVTERVECPAPFALWLDATRRAAPQAVSVRRLPALTRAELDGLIDTVAPRTTVAARARLLERTDANAGATVNALWTLRAHVHDGALTLDPDDMQNMVVSGQAMATAGFSSLPLDVQGVLALCALQGQTAFTSLVSSAAAVVADPVLGNGWWEALMTAVEPYGWLRVDPDGPTLRFSTALAYEASFTASRARFSQSQCTAIRRALLERIELWAGRPEWANLGPRAMAALVDLHVALAVDLLKADESLGDEQLILAVDSAVECVRGLRMASQGEQALERIKNTMMLINSCTPEVRGVAKILLARERSLTLIALGRYDEAVEGQGAVLAAAEARFGELNDFVASARNELALTLAEHGDPGEALVEEQKLLALLERLRVGDVLEVADVRVRVARSYRSIGALRDALLQLTIAIETLEGVAGPRSFVALDARHDRTRVLSKLGHDAEALAELAVLIEDCEDELGHEHVLTLMARGDHAVIRRDRGEVEEALKDLELLFETWTRSHGLASPDTLVAEANLAVTLRQAGRLDESLAHFETIVQLASRVFGESAETTIEARVSLARTLSVLGRRRQALTEINRVLAQQPQVAGSRSFDVLTARYVRASLLVETDEVDSGLREGRAVIADIERALGPEHPDTLRFQASFARLVANRGLLHEALEVVDRLVATAEAGAIPAQVLAARDVRADVLRSAGRLHDALSERQAVLAESRRIFGETSEPVLDAMKEVMVALRDSGRPDDALVLVEELLMRLTERHGGRHLSVFRARAERASVLRDLGRVKESLTELAAIEQSARAGDGWTNGDEWTVASNRAVLLYESGRLREALAAIDSLLPTLVDELGPTAPLTISAREKHAIMLSYIGRSSEAIAELRSVVADCEATRDPDHPRTLRARFNLAGVRLGIVSPRDALDELQDLLGRCARVLGPNHELVFRVRDLIVRTLRAAGGFDEALLNARALVADREQFLGERHPLTLDARSGEASVLAKMGRVEAALEAQERLLADATSILYGDDPTLLDLRSQMALQLADLDRFDEALPMLAGIVDERQRVSGDDHPATLDARADVARVLGESGQREAALLEQRALLEDYVSMLGADHPDGLGLRAAIATTLFDLERYDEALSEQDALLADRIRLLPADHVDTLIVRADRARSLRESGAPSDALAEQTALRHDCVTALGDDLPLTLTVRADQADTLKSLGDPAAARVEHTTVLDLRRKLLGEHHADTRASIEALAKLDGAPGDGRRP